MPKRSSNPFAPLTLPLPPASRSSICTWVSQFSLL
uniref:Dolichyl-diphosphooligosaccharideprotein glycosyltransferase subunit DAD1 n=1 Tax=Rhizophora mucronata TaxID=61149 RepID=A0A2P2JT91_RHIMU